MLKLKLNACKQKPRLEVMNVKVKKLKNVDTMLYYY